MTTYNLKFAESDTVYLRELQPKDYDVVRKAMRDFEEFPISDDRVINYMKGIMVKHRKIKRPYTSSSKHSEAFAICLVDDDTCVGMLEFHIEGLHCDIGLVAIHPDQRSKGYARDARKLVYQNLFDNLGITSMGREVPDAVVSSMSEVADNNGFFDKDGDKYVNHENIWHQKLKTTKAKWDEFKTDEYQISNTYTGDEYVPPDQR